MRGHMRHITGLIAVLAVAGCATSSFDRELGSETETGGFGNATMNNTLIQSGQMDYAIALEGRFAFDADGGLRAAGRRLTQVPHDCWVRVSVQAQVGAGASRRFDVTVHAPGRPPERFGNLSVSGSGFKNLNWLGFVSMATKSAVFYVDNVAIGPTGEATN